MERKVVVMYVGKSVPRVDAGLAASVFHFGEIAIPDLKAELKQNDINVRI